MADFSKLRDEITDPHGDRGLSRHLRVPDESVSKFIGRIKSLLVGDEYQYAESTLRGILQTVEESNKVTEGQVNAINNIAEKPNAGGDRRPLRRWNQ